MMRSLYKGLFLSLVLVALFSCSSEEFSNVNTEVGNQPVKVSVSLRGIDFNLQPMTRATADDAGITHIALKVFDTAGNVVADTCQIAAKVGTAFNKLGITLPAGTYTFVAVAHSATADNIPCATITSPTVTTLPEGIVQVLYSHVESVTISNTNNQAVPLDMGKRVNAVLHLASTDVVPADVSKMTIDINCSSNDFTYIKDASPVQFDPATGFATNNPRYTRLIQTIVGSRIDDSYNVLIPAQSYYYNVKVSAMDASNKTITSYTRVLENVPFQQAFITNAAGTYFRFANSSSLSFDMTTGTLDYDL